MILPSTVTAALPTEIVWLSTTTGVLHSEMKVSQPAARSPLLLCPGTAVARGTVDVPTIRAAAELSEYVRRPTTMPEEPGSKLEWLISKPPLLPERAVNL